MGRVIQKSAGTGKTETIATTYCKILKSTKNLLSNHPEKISSFLSSILGITFTRLATYQMKERILLHLRKEKNSPDLQRIYQTALCQYNSLSIHTLDSFLTHLAGKLLFLFRGKTFSQILVEEEEVVSELSKEILRTLKDNNDLREEILQVTEREDLSTNPMKEIRKSIQTILRIEYLGSPNLPQPLNLTLLGKEIWEKTVFPTLEEVVRVVYKSGEKGDGKGFKPLKWVKDIEEIVQEESSSKKESPFQKLRKVKEILKNNYTFVKEGRFLPKERGKSLPKKGDTLPEKVKTSLHKALVCSTLTLHFYRKRFFFTLQEMVKKNIREMEREGRFPLFRFPHLFSTLLSPTGNGFGEIPPISRPFVYEIYGAPFQHLLWDEFQDTSLPQYNALLPLLEEIHSSSEEGFLLVGDPKQSIHIFRDAYPELLKEVAERFSLTTPEETRANYRTVPDLLKFFHRFFSTAGEILEKSLFQPLPNELLEDKKKWIPFYREIYTDKELDLLPKREGPGFVLLCGLKVLKGKEEKGEYIFEKEKEGSEWDKTVLEKIVLSEPSLSEESPLSTFFSLPSWIQRFKDMGYSLEDMTILTRKREEGKKILTFLNKNGIPAISSESLSLSKDPLIQTLTHLIYYLFSSQLHTEKKDSLQNFYLWSSAIYLEDWLTEEKGEIPLNTLLSWIKEWAMKGKEKTQGFSTPLTLFYELTTVPLPFLSSKTLWEDPSAISSLSSMEEALRKFMEESGDDPGTFLAGWDSFLQKEKIPLFSGKGTTILSTEKRGGGKGGIQILTIHEAKGLENKVVFLPFLTWEFLGKGRRNEEEGIFVSGETLSSLFANLPLPKEISYPIPLKNHLMEILTSSPELFSDPLTKELLYRIVRKIVEEINLLYVGFTRARDILVGFTVVDPKTDKNDSFLFPYNNLSQIITKIIQEILSKEDLPSVFPIGFFRKEEDEKRIQKMEEYLSSFQPEIEKKGEDKPFHPPPSPRTSTHLSLLTPHIRSFREKEDERKREGERVHRILRLVRTLDDLPILSRLHSLTEKEEKIVTTLLSHKEIAPFFSPQTTHRWTIHREVSLLVQGRIVTPDRVLIEKGGRSAVVIEFKGILRKGVSEEVVSRYRNQVVMYLNSLKEMGWIPERGYLVFLDQVEEIEGTR